MNKLFVSYELAKLAIEKGFKDVCLAYYCSDGITMVNPTMRQLKRHPFIGAPLYQQLVDWFLEKHDIFVETLIFDRGFLEKNKFCFQWRIYNKSEEWETNLTEYKSPIEALTKALEEAFKLI